MLAEVRPPAAATPEESDGSAVEEDDAGDTVDLGDRVLREVQLSRSRNQAESAQYEPQLVPISSAVAPLYAKDVPDQVQTEWTLPKIEEPGGKRSRKSKKTVEIATNTEAEKSTLPKPPKWMDIYTRDFFANKPKRPQLLAAAKEMDLVVGNLKIDELRSILQQWVYAHYVQFGRDYSEGSSASSTS